VGAAKASGGFADYKVFEGQVGVELSVTANEASTFVLLFENWGCSFSGGASA